MDGFDPAGAARWLAEALETGNPLSALPSEIAPRDPAEAEAAAIAALDALQIAPCGLRLLRRPGRPPLAGPMLEGRLTANSVSIALSTLRYPQVTAAVVGILAEPLELDGAGPPRLARLHPALDVSSSRFAELPADDVTLTADLARLGLVVAGRPKPLPGGPVRVVIGRPESRSRGIGTDLSSALAEAADVARRWGGLPAGALLVIGGLSPPVAAEGQLRARLGSLGWAEATFV